MRCVVQRVTEASVSVDGTVTGAIGHGLVALVGVAAGDGPTDIAYVASKIETLRVFGDDQGRMNRSLADIDGAVLVVSQFTLLGDVRHGRRPGFDAAAQPDEARTIYQALVEALKKTGLDVETGIFQAHMTLALTNDGPVTILIDSRRLF